MNGRVDRVRERIDVPLLVTGLTSVRYLTGFQSSNAAVLVEPDHVRLFADFRYAEAGRHVPGVDFTITKRALVRDLANQLSGTIAFEAEKLPYADCEALAAAGLELVPTYGLVENVRAVKDEEEIEAIRAATGITNRAFVRFAEERVIGRTERELQRTMDTFLYEEGSNGNAFGPNIHAGPNAANPHASPTDRPVLEGETLVVDAGAILNGYCSDCTRTFASGGLDGELREAYDVCLRAQLAGLEGARPGVSGVDADMAARRVIDDAGYGEYFGHGLGHGVGLDIHELPRLSQESPETLEAGNVTSVEPGIYLPERGGIRIEDLVVVRDDGVEVLTSFTKELVTLN
jgi:Xaa-Pro aminopeptidase